MLDRKFYFHMAYSVRNKSASTDGVTSMSSVKVRTVVNEGRGGKQ